MAIRLLLAVWLLLAGGMELHAQAPGRAAGESYRRPDLQTPLFNALEVPITPREVSDVMRDLTLIVRNFPDGPWVNHRLRANAIAVALCLKPGDRGSLVANGQLARGVIPAPITADVPATPQGVALRLLATGIAYVDHPARDARVFAGLLLDLSGRLDPSLQSRISSLTYGVRPDWRDAAPDSTLWEKPPGFAVTRAEARVLLPGPENGPFQILTVKAEARPSGKTKGLAIALPEALQLALRERDKDALRKEVAERTDGLMNLFRLRHESRPDGWVVEISASDPKTQALPQLFAGMALTIETLLTGETPDPACLLAAGMDAGGRLQGVMPVDFLLSGAVQMKPAPMLILADEAGDELSDWLLQRPEQWTLLFQTAVHRAPSIGDAMALSKEFRASRLKQSLSTFAAVASRLRDSTSPITELRRPETLSQLREITSWHPHHLSAVSLLAVASGGPPTFSRRGSLRQIDTIARSVLSLDRRQFPLHIPPAKLRKSVFGEAMDALQAMTKKLHPDVRPYAAEVVLLAKMLDRTAGRWKAYLKGGPPEPPEISRQRGIVGSARILIDAKK